MHWEAVTEDLICFGDGDDLCRYGAPLIYLLWSLGIVNTFSTSLCVLYLMLIDWMENAISSMEGYIQPISLSFTCSRCAF